MRGPSRRHLEEERVAAVKVRVGVERSNVPGPYCLAGTVPRQSQPARPRPLPKKISAAGSKEEENSK